VAEVVVPAGLHTVEVAVLDEAGNGELFLRDLEFDESEWFYVGVADLTLAANLGDGRPDALEGEDAPHDHDSVADGRLAFYVTGKFGEDWKLTASADTREEPVEDLFSNFLDKSPDSLFRRIDPDPGQVLRRAEPAREPRPLGELQGRLPGQRAGPGGTGALRRQRPLPDPLDDELR
jgi:hypothetical protein